MKICTKCKVSEALVTAAGKQYSWCSPCTNGYNKRIKKADPAKYLSQRRSRHLLTKYGLSPEQFEELLATQDHVCAICSSDDWGPLKTPIVDHDHKTGMARGLLCNRCNLLLGNAKDQPEILGSAIAYLGRYGVDG